MARCLITYDLKKTKDYQKLFDALKKLGACKPLLSVWVVNSTFSAKQLVEHLKQFIDSDDKLLVVEATTWASLHLTKAENDCLRAQIAA
jgi:CRISPR-associated endonuclease Cas2